MSAYAVIACLLVEILAWDYLQQGVDWAGLANEAEDFAYCGTGQQSPIDLQDSFKRVEGAKDMYLTSYKGWSDNAARRFEYSTISYVPNLVDGQE